LKTYKLFKDDLESGITISAETSYDATSQVNALGLGVGAYSLHEDDDPFSAAWCFIKEGDNDGPFWEYADDYRY
jgi:hypothetical protein